MCTSMNLRNLNIGLLILGASLVNGCDDSYVSSIPNYPVSLQLNLTTTYPTFRNSINEFLTFKARRYEYDRIGFGGILVYSGLPDDYGNAVYYAFDMACPYEAQNNVRVYPVEDGYGQVKCEKCESVYDVAFGFGIPVSGPSKEALKKYKATLSNDVLYISR